MLNPLNQL